MFRRLSHNALILFTLLLFAKELPFVYQWQNDSVYLVQWAEEGEKKSDQKEQEEKSSDYKKFNSSTQYLLSHGLTAVALHLVADRSYSAPSGEINSPPPEVFHS